MMYVGTKRMNQILEVCVVMPYHMFDWEHRDHKANEVHLIYAYWKKVRAKAFIGSKRRYAYSLFPAFPITCE